MRHRALSLLLCVLVAAPVPALAADDPVQVVKKPPTVQTKTFDPKNPPKDVRLSGQEAAFTRSSFRCAAGVSYVVLPPSGRRPTAVIRIEGVKVDLTLDNTMYLPTNATRKLTAHEQGHRQIAEDVYASADAVARRLASALIGKRIAVSGTDPEVTRRASEAEMDKLCDQYMAEVAARSSRVNDVFDKLTDHGRNRLTEAEAIRRSFEQADGEKPAQAVRGESRG